MQSRDLKLIQRERGDLVAVIHVPTGGIGLIHDFSTNTSFPYDHSSATEAKLKARLGIADVAP